jgi:hypothetical protein
MTKILHLRSKISKSLSLNPTHKGFPTILRMHPNSPIVFSLDSNEILVKILLNIQ